MEHNGYPSPPIVYCSLALVAISFLVPLYENVYIPKKLKRETIAALKGLEKLNFKFETNQYIGKF
ncbi:hypothetical protein SAMN04488029_1034 [Reichenbachiella faecimaris]|uniref:Uncharacterized protein n=1 Tax=Reichenbachiella faecimaris TaxID=692418 RepID=A0A1W2G7R6_REIFA|nr:hypothetical protein SAMN04488029_1034 [Reichenbachiella faecimaris]